MIKYKYIELDNGPKLILCEDKSKNQTHMEIVINYGTINKTYKKDGIEHPINEGIAHLLEHKMVEDTIYGNMLDYFDDKKMDYNAYTNVYNTAFVFDTYHDFDKEYLNVIKSINIPSFGEERLVKIIPPIIQELKKEADYVNLEYNNNYNDIYFYNNKFKSNYGNANIVKNTKIDTLRDIYNAYYKKTNQTIFIAGNFDTDDVISKLKELYEKFSDNNNYEPIFIKESNKLNDKCRKITTTKGIDLCSVNFKIDLQAFTPYEKDLLTYCLSYFLDESFGNQSNLNKKIREEKLSLYSPRYYYNIKENILEIRIELSTKNTDFFSTSVLEIIEKKAIQKDIFELLKKRIIVDFLSSSNILLKNARSYYSNIMDFSYYHEDTIEDINNLSYDKVCEYINRLDFSNYFILIQERIGDKEKASTN